MMNCFDKSICAAFTGHRAIGQDAAARLPQILDRQLTALYGEGYRVFYNGGAYGFDLIAAEAVLRLRETHPDVRLILALPGAGQTERWNRENRERYEVVFAAADEKQYPAGASTIVSRETYLQRDRYMIDQASVCICYLTTLRGGTLYTVNYANQTGVRVINVAFAE